MAPTNIVESLLRIRFQSSSHWDAHAVVGLSSISFLAPASAFLAVPLCIASEVPRPYAIPTIVQLVLYGVLCLLFTGVAVTCLLADYAYIRRGHRSYYGKADIRLASFTFAVCTINFSLRASLAEVASVVAIVVVAFIFSGSSPSLQQWVIRHSLWHVAAGIDASFVALRRPPEEEHISGSLFRFALTTASAYAAFVVFVLGVRFAAPRQCREALWERGARLACWEPVGGCEGEKPQVDVQKSAPLTLRLVGPELPVAE